MKIDKHIVIPEKASYSAKYPWVLMKIGDSFFVDNYSANRASSLATCGNAWAKRNDKEKKFYVAKYEKGIRIWRVK